MTIIIKKTSDIKSSEITPKSIYINRRRFMKQAFTSSLLLGADAMMPAWAKRWPDLESDSFSTNDKLTSLEDIISYNNFYELGTGKKDPASNASLLAWNNA